MYPAKGNNLYGQQTYPGQQAYGQNEDIGAYRGYPQGTQYGGQYASVYGSANLANLQQARAGHVPPQPESAKFSSASLGPTTLGTAGHDYASTAYKSDQYSLVKGTDYTSVERRYYGEHHGGYMGRDLTSDQVRRYGDSGPVSHQNQSDVADRVDQAAVLRQQQMLKVSSLQPDPDVRHTDYLAARAAGVRHGPEDLSTYGGRIDAEPRPLPVIATSSYGGQHSASILGGAPRRNVDELLYLQGSSSSNLGVGLPPGRDYSAGKGVHGSSLDHEYQLSVASRGGHPSIGGPMMEDGRGAYQRELEIREEERRRELLLLEKEREREREHERERERERERDRDRERERERERARDRERERESERERERERERKRQIDRARDRERLRLLERREKEKERESRRERSPARKSRERRGSSKDGRQSRRISPHRDTSHRHHSPVKEKRREYVCKVNSYSLVEEERDYLSISKRYPRLSISPYFSKLVVHWPKGNLNVSLHTPVSFEHDIVDRTQEAEQMDIELSKEPPKSDESTTIWNAKVILMSGVSQDALEEMCSSKSSGDRIQHLNNILKFAVLRKGHSFLAIGGRWTANIDGGDPSVDDSALLRTVTRCVKDLINLDLQTCQHWNRFLEIHYDRVGSNGLFSHKEVTVLFLPDLRECLPSLDLWKSQWLERRINIQKKTKASPRKEKDHCEVEDKQGHNSASKSETAPEGMIGDGLPAEGQNDPQNSSNVANLASENQSEQANISIGDGQSANNNDEVAEKPEVVNETDNNKSGKKVIRRVLTKSAVKKANMDTNAKPDEVATGNVEAQKQDASETTAQQVSPSQETTAKKTFTRKKVVRKVVTRAAATNKGVSVVVPTEDKSSKEAASLQTETEANKLEGIPGKEAEVKTTGKKKIIRRVIKRKVKQNEGLVKSTDEQVPDAAQQKSNIPGVALGQSGSVDNITTADKPSAAAASDCQVEASEAQGEKQTSEHKINSDILDENEKQPVDDGKTNVDNSPNVPDIDVQQKDSKKARHDTKVDSTKVENDKKEGNSKRDSKVKSSKEVTKTISLEDAPQHPGLFLETKREKDTKMRSMSISLDGLLDYNEKDIEESTFELSLFAESLGEMVQFEMGCHLLSFLEKLHRKVVVRRSQKKRERKEKAAEEGAKSRKQLKVADGQPKEEPVKSKTHDSTTANDEKAAGKNDELASKAGEPSPKTGEPSPKTGEPSPPKADEPDSENKTVDDEPDDEMIDEFDDPEEVDDDGDDSDEEMENASTHSVEPIEPKDEKTTETKENESAVKKEHGDGVNSDAKVKKETAVEEICTEEKSTEAKDGQEGETQTTEAKDEKGENKVDDSGKSDAVVNKELLRAFRYFDRNRVGYIKVEDLRFILHSLGKFLSHRDVKEMVHSALLETNSARENRVLYDKLVKLSDV